MGCVKFQSVKANSVDVFLAEEEEDVFMPEQDKTNLSQEGREKAKIWDTPYLVPAVAVASSVILLSDSLLMAGITQT